MRALLLALGLAAAALAGWLLLGSDDAPGPDGAPREAGAVAPGDLRPTLAGRSEPAPEVDSTAPSATPSVPPVLATGLIVDATRRPVAGAEIVVAFSEKETGRTLSARDGRFEVPLLPPPPDRLVGTMVIRSGNAGAWRNVFLGAQTGERIDYGTIELADLHGVTVRVVRFGEPVAGAEVMLGEGRAPRAGTARLQSMRSDAAGLAHFEGVHGPKVGAYAVASGTGRAHREIDLPTAGIVDIELPEDRHVTIHVKHGVTGVPVVGAEVSLGGGGTLPIPGGSGCLPPMPELRTDASGNVVASGLPAGYIWVVARAPGLGMRNHGMMVERVIVQPEGAEATVSLWPYRAVRFPILETGAGAPPEGTQMEVHRYQPLTGYDVGHPDARIEEGQLVLEPFPPGHDWGHVVTADDCWAQWTAPLDKDIGDPIEFRKIHDLHVRLAWRDGAPASGEFLSAIIVPRGRRPPLRTNEEGRVVFERCIGESVRILWTPVATGFGMPIGSASLVTDPGLVVLSIDPPIQIVLRIRSGAVAQIPPGLEVQVPDLDPQRFGEPRDVKTELTEDADKGEISLRWLPMPKGGAPPVTVRARGIPDVVVTPQRGEDGVWRADVDLQLGALLRVRVLSPEGGRYWLKLERWEPAQNFWKSLHDHPGYEAGRRAVDGVHTMGGLAPGRYRLVEGYTGLASDPIELSGGDAVDYPFDLSSVVVVRGRVVVPEGENPAYAQFHVQGREQGQVSVSNPAGVTPDGTFEFRAVRGERLVLAARHPLLRLGGEPVAFTAGTDEPVVRFVVGPHVVFRLEGSDLTTADPDPNSMPSWWSPVHVRVGIAGRWDAQGRTSVTIAKQGVFRAGVPGPGTWTLRIEQHGFVPIVIENVSVTDGATDLGTLQPSQGTTLTVRLLAGDGGLPQDLSVQAELQGERPYSAWASELAAGEPPTMTLKGLGAGRFKVVVRQSFSKGPVLGEAFVDCDGAGPVALDVKLR